MTAELQAYYLPGPDGPELDEVTLWVWDHPGTTRPRAPWRWVRPPSLRRALSEGRTRCREIFGITPEVTR